MLAAAAYQSQRVYFQIQQWKGILLKPENWGWKLIMTAEKLLPVRTELLFLLEVVGHNCIQTAAHRDARVDRSPACDECKSHSCTIIQPRLT